MFATVSHFHPSLILEDKFGSQQLELSPVRGSILGSSSLAYKYLTRMEVTESGKYSPLVQASAELSNIRLGWKWLAGANALASENSNIHRMLIGS